ncbi:MAG: 50S ribosomal protein L10 [Candidatus Gastranaerophilales bacterium]|nr:50S ribosomal protein L10 [Candidatus Gastranaerophilales bacterium]
MATKAFKQEKIDAIKEKVSKAKVAIVTEYKGFTVEEITNLRRALQKENGDYMVTKNTLAKLAIKDTEFEVLADKMTGPIAIAFGYEDQAAPAKVLEKFIKATKKGEIVAAALDGQLLDADQVKALASIPSREELYAKMLGCVNSPATGIAGAVNAVMSSLVRAIDAVAKQKAA